MSSKQESTNYWVLGGQCKDEEETKKKIKDLIWFSYRSGIVPAIQIERGSGLKTDVGWGCMIRAGQMLVGNSLLKLRISQWDQFEVQKLEAEYRSNICRYFLDDGDALFSIQRICLQGESLGKSSGDWFGPATIASVFHSLSLSPSSPLPIFFPPDSCLYHEQLYSFLHSNSNNSNHNSNHNNSNNNSNHNNNTSNSNSNSDTVRPFLLLLPLRLGIESPNPVYFEQLSRIFTWPMTMGFVGGRPGSAAYFCGVDTHSHILYYLDPHTNQPVVTSQLLSLPSGFLSFSPLFVHSMPFFSLDPSLALGFLIRSDSDLTLFEQLILSDLSPTIPLFSISQSPASFSPSSSSSIPISSATGPSSPPLHFSFSDSDSPSSSFLVHNEVNDDDFFLI